MGKCFQEIVFYIKYCFLIYFLISFSDLTRRPIDMNERILLKDAGVVTETQCDLGMQLSPRKLNSIFKLTKLI